MELLSGIRHNVIEPQIHAPKNEEQACRNQEIRDVGERGPIHCGLAFAAALGPGSFTSDEVGGDES